MSSTLGCIGMAVDDAGRLDALVERLLPEAAVVASIGDLQARRWTDATGASLTMTVRTSGDDHGVLVDVVPSYAPPQPEAEGVRVGSLTGYGETLAAHLVDAAGETLATIACDLAQSIVTEIDAATGPRPAHLTALGLDVTVHADAAAFAASDESVLGVAGSTPTRFATESLLAYGFTEAPEKAQPMAFLTGTVLSTSSHVNGETEQRFHTARVRGAVGAFTVCLAASDHAEAPDVGSVLSGVCYLVLDVPDLS